MDLNNAYSQAGITGSVIALIGVAWRVCRQVSGKRCRSNCCGYEMEADFKVDDLPPSPPAAFKTNPMVDANQSVRVELATQNR